NYIEKIENNWRKIINENDTVVIAGDISWSMSLSTLIPDFEFLDSLPGKKLIIKGNHDFWWDTMTKMNNFLETNGFHSIKIIHNNAELFDNYAVCGTRGWFYDAQGSKKIMLREAQRLETSIESAEKAFLEPLVFLHYPPVCVGYCCDEILDVLKTHNIKNCYFGHLHGRAAVNAFEGEYAGICFRLISCDHTNFAPVIIRK
ncbi:MAG TPA: metallophosphoesterase, partial [Ruminiclostridium sp.]|nr:metallophosphoesterase [Ruminiclostridium sp.]